MEISNFKSLAENMEIEDPSLFQYQWPVNAIDDLSTISMEGSYFDMGLYDHPLIQTTLDFKRPNPERPTDNRPLKQPKIQQSAAPLINHQHMEMANYTTQTGIMVRHKEEKALSNNSMISTNNHTMLYDQNNGFNTSQHAKRISTDNARLSHAQDHIIAERKRREKLSQRFIALSALIPGLKKMDKATVLGDAIKYLKKLQEKVKTLEEQAKNKSTESAVIVVKRHDVYVDDQINLPSSTPDERSLPEIEARFCEKDVLIRIHCEKHKGVVEITVSEIEKLNLSVIGTSVVTFGSSTLDITITAKMSEGFSMTAKDFMKNLRSSLKMLM